MSLTMHSHNKATGEVVWKTRAVKQWRGKRLVVHGWSLGWVFFSEPQTFYFSALNDPLDWSGVP